MRTKRRFRSSTLRDVKGGASYGQTTGGIEANPGDTENAPEPIHGFQGQFLRLKGLQVEDIDAGNITTGTLTTTRLNLSLVIVSGAAWTDNSPGAGSVAWSACTVYYLGTAYSITGSNTALKYIWWSSTTSNTTFQSSDTRPTLLDNEFLIATNTSGAHDIAWNAYANTALFPAHLSFDSVARGFLWGDGSDGTVTISANTTLTRDMMYDVLTVNGGVTLTTAGFRVYCKTSLTVNSTGIIDCSGTNGTNGAAGSGGQGATGRSDGTMGGSGTGGQGGSTNNSGTNPTDGQAGGSVNNSLGGLGGSGGASAGAVMTAAGGSTTPPKLKANRHVVFWITDTAELRGGSGGGGGAGAWTGTPPSNDAHGGGGGAGGGVIIIMARTITNNGTIRANGGTGGNGSFTGNGVGASGGGGGGGGGALLIAYWNLTVAGTMQVNGGNGGTGLVSGFGTSGGGTNGSTGTTILVQQESA